MKKLPIITPHTQQKKLLTTMNYTHPHPCVSDIVCDASDALAPVLTDRGDSVFDATNAPLMNDELEGPAAPKHFPLPSYSQEVFPLTT